MVSFTAVTSWCIVLTLCLTGRLCTGQQLEDADTCGQTFNNASGTVHVYTAKSVNVPENISCTWTIQSLSNKSIFLVFENLYLLDGDEIRISADGKALEYFDPINLTNVLDVLPCITGKTNITVMLNTTSVKVNPSRTFVMNYYTNSTDYIHSFTPAKSGQIQSPVYNPKITSPPPKCTLEVSVPNKDNQKLNLWFEKFMFTSGNVNMSGDSAHYGVYNAFNLPTVEFLANDTLVLDMTFGNVTGNVTDSFVLRYDAVTRMCSEDMEVTTEGDASVQSPSANLLKYLRANKDLEMICHWLIETVSGQTLEISNVNALLPEAMDQLLILDGPNRSSPVLFDMNNRTNGKLQGIFSKGNYLWISASAPTVSKDFMVNLRVSQKKSGGRMQDKGQLSVSDKERTVFLLEVNPDKQVQLVFDQKSTVLKDSGSISFYKDFMDTSKPFLTLTSQNMSYVVGSPTAQMAVVTSGFKTSSLNGNFAGIDKGCFKYGDDSSGTFSVSGHCDSSCGWMIQPMSSNAGLLAFHFQTLNLSESDRVIIRMMDTSQTVIANISSPTSRLPDLWMAAEMGAFVQVTRSNCSSNSTVIQSNYQVTPKCAATYTPGVRQTVGITSVGYPNHYPLGGSCMWNVAKPKESAFLHVSFSDLQLAKEDHVLEVYEVNGTNLKLLFSANSTNKALPMDMAIKGDVMINLTAKAVMPLHSMPGFNLTVTAVESGDILVNSTGKIETPGFPKAINGSALYVWLVQVNTTEQQEEIVQFSFANGTDLTELIKYLKIYDGATLRSDIIKNFTYPTVLLSRTNELMFVYESDGKMAAPGFSVSYQNHSCNMTLSCDNKICMHEDWKCNGINDCGDFSDEKNCKGGVGPIPTPIPPAPTPSDGSKGVSTAALAVGILIALVIGAILGIGAPAAFKKLRGNRFQNYSSFTNNIE